jgi:hypothetical protein
MILITIMVSMIGIDILGLNFITEPIDTRPSHHAVVWPEPTPTKILESETSRLGLPGAVFGNSQFEIRLFLSGLKYIADSPQAADQRMKEINFIAGEVESASNACGPLSIAILRDGGAFPKTIPLHDIWLLNLRLEGSLSLLHQIYFPPQTYSYHFEKTSTREYDFSVSPLQPGDWMYLFADQTGFDHMLVVTRVDHNGAAYTVTNIDRGDGFKISQELLYDPAQPGKGLFYELTSPDRGMLGKSGQGGFLLVRRKEEENITTGYDPALSSMLDPDANWHIVVKDLTDNEIEFASLPNHPFDPARLINVPIAMVALHVLEQENVSLSEFAVRGHQERTFDQLFTAMIVHDEDNAADNLLNYIKSKGGADAVLNRWGVNHTSLTNRLTTGYDLMIFLEGLYEKQWLSEDFRQYLLELMETHLEHHPSLLSIPPSTLVSSIYYQKQTISYSPTIIGEMGILTTPEKVYLLMISAATQKDGTSPINELKANIISFGNVLVKRIIEK